MVRRNSPFLVSDDFGLPLPWHEAQSPLPSPIPSARASSIVFVSNDKGFNHLVFILKGMNLRFTPSVLTYRQAKSV